MSNFRKSRGQVVSRRLTLGDQAELASDGNYYFNDITINDMQRVEDPESLDIESLVFTNAWPNIHPFFQNTKFELYNAARSSSWTIELDSNNYDDDTIAIELATQLSASGLGGTWTVDIDDVTSKLTVDNDTNEFAFSFSSDNSNPQTENERKHSALLWGFRLGQEYDSSSQSLTSPFAVDLVPVKQLLVAITNIQFQDSLTSGSVNYTFNVPCGYNAGEIINYVPRLQDSQIMTFDHQNQSIRTLEIRLLDQYGRFIPMGSPWYLSLVFTQRKRISSHIDDGGWSKC